MAGGEVKVKDIPITEFKKMLVSDIKQGGSFNLVADGEFLAIVVIPASAFKKEQIQGFCIAMNQVTGKV